MEGTPVVRELGVQVAFSLGLYISKVVAFIMDCSVFVIAVIVKAIMFITEKNTQNTDRPMDLFIF